MDTIISARKLREIIPTLQFTLQFNRNFKSEDWKDMYPVLQLHQLLKDLFQWSIDNRNFDLASHCAELGTCCQKAVQPPGVKGSNDNGEPSPYPSYRRTTEPEREYFGSFRLTRSRPTQLSNGFTLFRNQHISGQESP
ncbi:hypothetical protein O181_046303 [Austropuccinia psidii MF-1]|uniref:Uncharacterized protein n=1 Tax=Austropuccinia psidii MF-1 TaxID=1389203 RepID=A0A9Q3HIF0_9BASI|nr:hypothetical protein [Austropuccinia psidii MF-1]